MVQPLWKTVWQLLKKLNTELTYDLSIPLQGIYSKHLKAGTGTDICVLIFIPVSSTITKAGKSPKCPQTDTWINRMWYIHKKILSSLGN